jgi:negative regulator of sigma E activity
MKHEFELKVQAWLDGELPDPEARQIGERVARDPEAAALAAELGCIRQAMSHQETIVTLGESREFYWSKIQRLIQREAGVRRTGGLPWHARWRKYMAPLAGVAAMVCVLVLAVTRSGSPAFDEIFATAGGMEAVTFHDQSAQMTVVWLQDNSPATAEQPAPKNIRYEDEPGTVIDLE